MSENMPSPKTTAVSTVYTPDEKENGLEMATIVTEIRFSFPYLVFNEGTLRKFIFFPLKANFPCCVKIYNLPPFHRIESEHHVLDEYGVEKLFSSFFIRKHANKIIIIINIIRL
jgi:hypothetical protein